MKNSRTNFSRITFIVVSIALISFNFTLPASATNAGKSSCVGLKNQYTGLGADGIYGVTTKTICTEFWLGDISYTFETGVAGLEIPNNKDRFLFWHDDGVFGESSDFDIKTLPAGTYYPKLIVYSYSDYSTSVIDLPSFTWNGQAAQTVALDNVEKRKYSPKQLANLFVIEIPKGSKATISVSKESLKAKICKKSGSKISMLKRGEICEFTLVFKVKKKGVTTKTVVTSSSYIN